MSHALSVPIGVVVARERSANPWQEYRWRPVRVFIDTAEFRSWREVERGRGYVHYHAATMPLVLKSKEKVAYRINLTNGVPSVYVVLRENTAAGGAMPIAVAHLTVSPFEIQAYSDQGSDIVDRVPMPEPLVQQLQSFVEDGQPGGVAATVRSAGWKGMPVGFKFGV